MKRSKPQEKDRTLGKRGEAPRENRAKKFPRGLRMKLRIALIDAGVEDFRTDLMKDDTLVVTHDHELPCDMFISSFEGRPVRYIRSKETLS